MWGQIEEEWKIEEEWEQEEWEKEGELIELQRVMELQRVKEECIAERTEWDNQIIPVLIDPKHVNHTLLLTTICTCEAIIGIHSEIILIMPHNLPYNLITTLVYSHTPQ